MPCLCLNNTPRGAAPGVGQIQYPILSVTKMFYKYCLWIGLKSAKKIKSHLIITKRANNGHLEKSLLYFRPNCSTRLKKL